MALQAKLDMSLDDVLAQEAFLPPGAPGGSSKGSAGHPVGKRCYVGNISFRTSWQDLKDHFKQAGRVVHAKILEDEATGSSKGCGIVEFESAQDAATAIVMLHDKELGGRLLTVREDREDRDLKPGTGTGVFGSSKIFTDAKRARTTGSFGNSQSNGGTGTDSRRCYVGNLSYRTSWQDLKDHFKPIGKVVYTSVMEETPGRSKGCGIVEFETSHEAAKAIQMLHDSELKGRQIFVREDREDKELRQVPGLTSAKDRDSGKGKGKGGGGGGGYAPAPAKGGHRPAAHEGSRRVYVGNLTYRTSWQDLKDHFRTVGKVVYSNVMEETGTGRSKGCGIVEFETSREAAQAIRVLHDSMLNGRQIFVREDREDRDVK